ncbi:MAG: hypothetical protein A3D92_16175, partial [Bacteroidetes bacterium RIFCSPHIGHO2_02_FULL_44_7]
MVALFTDAAEISIIAVNRIKMRRLSGGGSKAAKIILKILESPEIFFSTILVTNNIVTTLIASIVTAQMITLVGSEKGIIFATTIVALIIVLCEVIAKTLAASYSEKISLLLARPVSVLIIILSPLVKGIVNVTNFTVRLISGNEVKEAVLFTEEEIKSLIKIGQEEGILHKEKYKLLSKIFDFSETVVKDVMTPKKDMVAIDINSDFNDILNKALESGYSRLPVYKDNPDNIVGIMNMKDLLIMACNRELVLLQDIVYQATVVANSKKITEILKEFQKGHTH